jgi:hypothetical protein
VQKGELEVALNGAIAPRSLPRDRLAPIALTISGRVGTTARSVVPPRVQEVQVTIAGHGVLATRGLPTCPRARLENASSVEALRRCRRARVGHGWLGAEIAVPHQSPFPIRARLLAFNGKATDGGAAIWLHLYTADPPVAFVVPVGIGRKPGRFTTRLSLRVPRSLHGLAHLTAFSLTLSRRFRDRGRERSYLSASCPIPPSLTAGFLSVARATYAFAGGKRVSVESVRGCRAL